MVSVPPHLAPAAERTVDRLRNPDREPLDAAAKLVGPVALHEEMDVVALDAVVEQSESILRCLPECRSRGGEDVIAPKRRKRVACAERDVHRSVAIVRGATPMRHAPPTGCRLASCARTAPAPRGWRRELQLPTPVSHLESAHITPSLLACQASLRDAGTELTDVATGLMPDHQPTDVLSAHASTRKRLLPLARPGPRNRHEHHNGAGPGLDLHTTATPRSRSSPSAHLRPAMDRDHEAEMAGRMSRGLVATANRLHAGARMDYQRQQKIRRAKSHPDLLRCRGQVRHCEATVAR